MEKYRKDQRELHCVFVYLENAYDRVPREELSYCMRKSGMAEKYVRLVQDMYEGSETVVRCAVGTTESFKAKVGQHLGSVLSLFLFAVIMDRLMDEVRREPSWTIPFADDIVICEETRKEVKRRLKCWRYALLRRGMKVSILLCPWERHFTALFPAWWSWQTILNYSNISTKLLANSNILASPEAGRGNCLLYV